MDHSTYICPQANHLKRWIRMLQVFGVLLDAIIINLLSKISKEGHESGKPWGRLGQLVLATVGVMFVVAWLCVWWNPPYNYTRRYDHWTFFADSKTFLGVSLATLLGTNFVLSAVYLLAEFRPTTIVVTASCIFVYIYQVASSTSDYLIVPDRALNLLCLAAFAAAFGIVRMEREASKAQHLSLYESENFRVFVIILHIAQCCFLRAQIPAIFNDRQLSNPSNYGSHLECSFCFFELGEASIKKHVFNRGGGRVPGKIRNSSSASF